MLYSHFLSRKRKLHRDVNLPKIPEDFHTFKLQVENNRRHELKFYILSIVVLVVLVVVVLDKYPLSIVLGSISLEYTCDVIVVC